MGERKVLSKYYPPDFDPAAIPAGKRQKNKLLNIRMMMPMSVQCSTCGEFVYQGTKFNSRKEVLKNETYLGIRIHRFFIKCPTCKTQFTFVTDPKNADYKPEKGCHRLFEPWKERAAQNERAMAKREHEERGDAMRALENRTADSKREMDLLNALDELRSLNDRNVDLDTADVLARLAALREEQAAAASGGVVADGGVESGKAAAVAMAQMIEDDEAAVEAMFGSATGEGRYLKRLVGDDVAGANGARLTKGEELVLGGGDGSGDGSGDDDNNNGTAIKAETDTGSALPAAMATRKRKRGPLAKFRPRKRTKGDGDDGESDHDGEVDALAAAIGGGDDDDDDDDDDYEANEAADNEAAVDPLAMLAGYGSSSGSDSS